MQNTLEIQILAGQNLQKSFFFFYRKIFKNLESSKVKLGTWYPTIPTHTHTQNYGKKNHRIRG